jgi:hypothetical protein
VPARLLGGTLAAFCRKEGKNARPAEGADQLEAALSCPDCGSPFSRQPDETLRCTKCGYLAANEGGVYTLLRSADRKELYPGDCDDLIDFSQPGHERNLVNGWYDLEGVFGNKYRWIGERATARLASPRSGPQLLRIRGFAHPRSFEHGQPVRIEVLCNGRWVAAKTLERSGIFVVEADVSEAAEYVIEVRGSPTFQVPPDDRVFTVILSMLRLVARE